MSPPCSFKKHGRQGLGGRFLFSWNKSKNKRIFIFLHLTSHRWTIIDLTNLLYETFNKKASNTEKQCLKLSYVPRTGIEPVTRGFSVLCSTNWAIWANNEQTTKPWTMGFVQVAGIGFEPMTFGLWARRASRLLHPAIVIKWAEVDSNHRSNLQQIYSLSPLATRESAHSHICAKPMIGLEPITCWLQISCSANWATSA